MDARRPCGCGHRALAVGFNRKHLERAVGSAKINALVQDGDNIPAEAILEKDGRSKHAYPCLQPGSEQVRHRSMRVRVARLRARKREVRGGAPPSVFWRHA